MLVPRELPFTALVEMQFHGSAGTYVFAYAICWQSDSRGDSYFVFEHHHVMLLLQGCKCRYYIRCCLLDTCDV